MGAALSVQTYFGTAIGAALAPLVPVSGDSLAVQNFELSKKAWLLQMWADTQLAGTVRVRSPKFHDNVNGIRVDNIASDVKPLLPYGAPQRLYPNDNLIVELLGSVTAGQLETVTLLQYYEDLPGIAGRFITPEVLTRRMEHLLTVENTLTTGATGGYSGSEAINAEIDQFQHGVDYALLGFKVDTECGVVGWRAPDFGNMRIGGPGTETDEDLTVDWFITLSKMYNLPLIPVFNGQNKASVLIDCVQDQAGADPTVTTFLAKLAA